MLFKKQLDCLDMIKDSPLTCSDCERRGTMDCPNSYMCYSTKDKPYFKSKHNGK